MMMMMIMIMSIYFFVRCFYEGYCGVYGHFLTSFVKCTTGGCRWFGRHCVITVEFCRRGSNDLLRCPSFSQGAVWCLTKTHLKHVHNKMESWPDVRTALICTLHYDYCARSLHDYCGTQLYDAFSFFRSPFSFCWSIVKYIDAITIRSNRFTWENWNRAFWEAARLVQFERGGIVLAVMNGEKETDHTAVRTSPKPWLHFTLSYTVFWTLGCELFYLGFYY